MTGTARIVVVGGGIVGASAAYHLARAGASVLIAEGGETGTATAAGAGIICPWTVPADDASYRLAAEGAGYYPELVALLAEDRQDHTGYARVGGVCVTDDTARLDVIEARLRSRLGGAPQIGQVEILPAGGARELFPPLAPGLGAVWISGAARVDGRAMRDSLLGAAVARGALLIAGAASLTAAGGRVTGVTVGSERIEADAVLVAAGAWTAHVCRGIAPDLPIGPQKGQIVHLDLPGCDTGGWPVVLPGSDPYLLAFPDSRVVVGATREQAGFDHRVTAGGISGLLAGALAVAPGLADATLAEIRVGFRPVTSDGDPLLGPLSQGLIVAAGNGAEGLTAGPMTGRLAASMALAEHVPDYVAGLHPARAT
jgi:D-amino-acid dehydrogenase